MCNCKNSANAPFCNGTHRDMIRAHHKSHRGFYEIWGEAVFYLGFVYMYWNWYTWLNRCKDERLYDNKVYAHRNDKYIVININIKLITLKFAFLIIVF